MNNKHGMFALGDVNLFRPDAGQHVRPGQMAATLTGVFGLPRDLVLSRMLPGSAVGVLKFPVQKPGLGKKRGGFPPPRSWTQGSSLT